MKSPRSTTPAWASSNRPPRTRLSTVRTRSRSHTPGVPNGGVRPGHQEGRPEGSNFRIFWGSQTSSYLRIWTWSIFSSRGSFCSCPRNAFIVSPSWMSGKGLSLTMCTCVSTATTCRATAARGSMSPGLSTTTTLFTKSKTALFWTIWMRRRGSQTICMIRRGCSSAQWSLLRTTLSMCADVGRKLKRCSWTRRSRGRSGGARTARDTGKRVRSLLRVVHSDYFKLMELEFWFVETVFLHQGLQHVPLWVELKYEEGHLDGL